MFSPQAAHPPARQRARNGGGFAPRLAAARGRGQALPDTTSAQMQQRFGHDFAQVRVHADGEAARLTQALRSRAFTAGNDLFFGAGQFRPHEPAGQRLLAHELAHVVQQRGVAADMARIEPRHSAAEREAEGAAAAVSAGRPAPTLTARPVGIACDVGWAQRGPIPDPYGMGYNTIFSRAGAASEPAVHDLRSLETRSMGLDLPKFVALPLARRMAVLALEAHAGGTACEPWFAQMRAAPGHRADALAGTMDAMTGQLYWVGPSGPDTADGHKIKTTARRPVDAAAPDVAANVGKDPKDKRPVAIEENINAFALWMRGGSAPTATSKMNCWEAAMYAAYVAGLVSEQRLRQIHQDAAAAKGGYSGVIANALGMGSAKALGTDHPGRGDIVFFNGIAHVAVSLGSRDAAGEHHVSSLWIMPPDPAKKAFVSSVQRTTIEALSRSMVTYTGKKPVVTFAPNPF